MIQQFTSYDDMPIWLVDYILTVSGAKRITDLSLEDINGFLQGQEDFNRSQYRNDVTWTS